MSLFGRVPQVLHTQKPPENVTLYILKCHSWRLILTYMNRYIDIFITDNPVLDDCEFLFPPRPPECETFPTCDLRIFLFRLRLESHASVVNCTFFAP